MYEVESSFGGGFTPYDLDNQVLFWDFNDASSYTLDAGKASALHDLFGISSDFTAALDPSRGAVTLGNLICDGNQNYVSNDSAAYWNFLSNGSEFSIFFSIKSTENNSTGSLFHNNDFSTPRGVGILIDDRTSLSRNDRITLRIVGESAAIVINTGINNTVTEGAMSNSAIVYDYASATAGTKAADVYKNGADIGDLLLTAKVASSTDLTTTLRAFGSTGAGNFNGEVRAIIITSDLLTSEEVASLNTYFS